MPWGLIESGIEWALTGALAMWPAFAIPLLIIGLLSLFFGICWLVNGWREKRGYPRGKLEPAHLIVAGLVGTLLCSAAAIAGLIWQYFNVNSASTAPTITSTVASPPTDVPAGPHSGPIGPIAALGFWSLLQKVPKPCTIRITSLADNENMRQTLRWIADFAKCEMFNETGVKSIDEHKNEFQEAGFLIHYEENNKFGEAVAHFFDSMAAKVLTSHKLPKNAGVDLIWIEIGPGSPWRR